MSTDVQNVESKRKIDLSCFRGLELFAVQSIACVLVLLTVMVFRLIGNGAMEDITMRFQQAMLQRPLITASANTESSDASTAELSTKRVVNEPVVVCAPLVGGVLTSSFGEREDPFDTTQADYHKGVDIAAPEGTPLAAMIGGIVEKVDYDESGYGHYVIVSSDAQHRYLYAHCLAIQCKVGQKVESGQTVALVGNTGKSTGSHVHIEWMENGETVDPLTVLPKETYA